MKDGRYRRQLGRRRRRRRSFAELERDGVVVLDGELRARRQVARRLGAKTVDLAVDLEELRRRVRLELFVVQKILASLGWARRAIVTRSTGRGAVSTGADLAIGAAATGTRRVVDQ